MKTLFSISMLCWVSMISIQARGADLESEINTLARAGKAYVKLYDKTASHIEDKLAYLTNPQEIVQLEKDLTQAVGNRENWQTQVQVFEAATASFDFNTAAKRNEKGGELDKNITAAEKNLESLLKDRSATGFRALSLAFLRASAEDFGHAVSGDKSPAGDYLSVIEKVRVASVALESAKGEKEAISSILDGLRGPAPKADSQYLEFVDQLERSGHSDLVSTLNQICWDKKASSLQHYILVYYNVKNPGITASNWKFYTKNYLPEILEAYRNEHSY